MHYFVYTYNGHHCSLHVYCIHALYSQANCCISIVCQKKWLIILGWDVQFNLGKRWSKDFWETILNCNVKCLLKYCNHLQVKSGAIPWCWFNQLEVWKSPKKSCCHLWSRVTSWSCCKILFVDWTVDTLLPVTLICQCVPHQTSLTRVFMGNSSCTRVVHVTFVTVWEVTITHWTNKICTWKLRCISGDFLFPPQILTNTYFDDKRSKLSFYLWYFYIYLKVHLNCHLFDPLTNLSPNDLQQSTSAYLMLPFCPFSFQIQPYCLIFSWLLSLLLVYQCIQRCWMVGLDLDSLLEYCC